VYKGQGLIQYIIMIYTYKTFLFKEFLISIIYPLYVTYLKIT